MSSIFIRFCDSCDNILHLEGTGPLFFHCYTCETMKEVAPEEYSALIVRTFNRNTQKIPPDISQFINEYTIYDKTLPRKELPCTKCQQPRPTLTILVDAEAMKYIHLCETCGTY